MHSQTYAAHWEWQTGKKGIHRSKTLRAKANAVGADHARKSPQVCNIHIRRVQRRHNQEYRFVFLMELYLLASEPQ